jgi:ABC-type uncharacterized transport system substrate-binding protein
MASHIGRRKFLAALGGAAAAWPIAAVAQQPAMPVVGFLRSATLTDAAHLVTAFRQGLKEARFVEGQNVAVEYRSAEGQPDRLPALVADLVRRPVALIVANNEAAIAAKAATTTVPIVFVTGGDPLTAGLVNSLNRPGGNITGVSFISSALAAKQLELLRQLVPKATVMAALVDPNYTNAEIQLRNVQEAARSAGVQLRVVKGAMRARSMPRLPASSNSVPTLSLPKAVPFSSAGVTKSSRWQRDMPFPRFIRCGIMPLRAA